MHPVSNGGKSLLRLREQHLHIRGNAFARPRSDDDHRQRVGVRIRSFVQLMMLRSGASLALTPAWPYSSHREAHSPSSHRPLPIASVRRGSSEAVPANQERNSRSETAIVSMKRGRSIGWVCAVHSPREQVVAERMP